MHLNDSSYVSEMPYILYSGIGAKESETHSIEEFLNITKNASSHYYEMTSLGFEMEYKNYLLPDDFVNFTLEEWIDYSGAAYCESESEL
jgi:hypothetical protein